MRIQIGGLSEGEHEYRFRAEVSELELQESFRGDVEVDVTLEKTGNQLFLRGLVRAKGTFPCDRCTGSFDYPISATYQMYYLPEGSDTPQIDPAELQTVPYGAGIIDIAEDVRQTVLLAVPLKLLCSEDCEGLCPRCGRNLNIGTCSCRVVEDDPRWEGLRPLREKN